MEAHCKTQLFDPSMGTENDSINTGKVLIWYSSYSTNRAIFKKYFEF